MAFLHLTNNRDSDAYRFSVYHKSDPDLLQLKDRVKRHNANIRSSCRKYGYTPSTKLKRISLMARGTRRIDGERIHHNCDSYLQHEHARYYDVYEHDDWYNTQILATEIERGLTSSMQSKITRAEADIREYTWQLEDMLRDHGIYKRYINGEATYMSREKSIEHMRANGLSDHIIMRMI